MTAPDRIDFLAKDPRWTWIGWKLSAESRERAAREAGVDPCQAALTLRLYDLSAHAGPGGPPSFDVEVLGDTDHWYLPLDGGPVWLVRVGFKAAGGTFHAIAESAPLRLPPERPPDREGREWSELPVARRGDGGGEEGYLLIVLHSHLPFVRHPELENAAEERWLFEAVHESYIPLLRMLSRLDEEVLPFHLTLSLTPTLLEMLGDPLLQARCMRYVEERSGGRAVPAELCGKGGLVARFRELRNSGRVAVLASCASHAFLPLWASYPEAVELQVRIGVDHYQQTFGQAPDGFWLPECGFSPGVDEVLAGSGLRYFFLDAHGILNGTPRPRFGVHSPILSPAGIAAFGRDWQSHDLVWRKEVGYPGDPAYLDRSSGRRQGGGPYDPGEAFRRCDEHAGHFVEACRRRVEELRAALGRKPVLVALFDTEHFGHWWHEGPVWLDLVIRKLTCDQKTVRLISAGRYLEIEPTHQAVVPAASSWGYQGYSETWLMGRNHWIYPLCFEALDVLRDLGRRSGETETSRILLDQYIRELLLAQSSDWAFILHARTVESYAAGRVAEHAENMRRLAWSLESGIVDENWLATVRSRNNLFSSLPLGDTYREILEKIS